MDEKLNYEKTGVSLPDEVKAAYEYAVENNYKHYRAVSKTGTYYGYVNGRVVHADAEQEWFDNPEYVEPQPEVQIQKPLKPLSDLDGEPVTELIDSEEEEDEEDENLISDPDEPCNYKALYEETSDELKYYKAQYEAVSGELARFQEAIFTIVKEFRAANEKLKEDE